MDFTLSTTLIALGIFVAVLICLEFGRWAGKRALRADTDGEGSGIGAIEAALFGLLGLLLAFTFSGGAARFDARRQLVIDESNMIGTAYLRVDLLPAADQPAIKDKFRQYVDARIKYYADLSDTDPDSRGKAFEQLQRDIWTGSVASARESGSVPASTLLLPAINEMIDITNTRAMSAKLHPPMIVYVMLVVMILACAALAGFGSAKAKTRSWLHIVIFALVLASTVFVIVDLEYPRRGFIRVDDFDRALIELRSNMN